MSQSLWGVFPGSAWERGVRPYTQVYLAKISREI